MSSANRWLSTPLATCTSRETERDAQLRHGLPTVATSTTLGLPLVAKLDNTGTVVAAQTWGTAAVSDVLGIAVDSSSNVVIAGDVGVGVDANFGAPWAPSTPVAGPMASWSSWRAQPDLGAVGLHLR